MSDSKGSAPQFPFRPSKSFLALFSELVLKDRQIRRILERLGLYGCNMAMLTKLEDLYSNLRGFLDNRTPEERVSNIFVLFGTGPERNYWFLLIQSLVRYLSIAYLLSD